MSFASERIFKLVGELPALARRHRLQLILALRVTLAVLIAYVVAQVLHLRLPLWAVMTSLIVTQMSLGRSLKVANDYLMGTVIGVAYSGALALLIPHTTEWALLGVLALAVAPLALVAAFKANFNVLPVTAVIVLLVPAMQQVSLAASAFDRVLEVVVGGAVGFLVSALVWPARGHQLTTDTAASMLGLIANALDELLKDVSHAHDAEHLRAVQDKIGGTLVRLVGIGAEAEHERNARLTSAPDTGPLLRTLLRLRHDMVILGRATGHKLPDQVVRRLSPAIQQVATTVGDFLRSAGAALRNLAPPPSLDAVDAAYRTYVEAFGAVRRDEITNDTPHETVERLFAIGFALEQVHQHLADLRRVIEEWGPAME